MTHDNAPAAMAVIKAELNKEKRKTQKQLQEERLNRMERILKNQGRRYPLWTFARTAPRSQTMSN
jgi:hypothetical protein